jgi:hypothetical protein
MREERMRINTQSEPKDVGLLAFYCMISSREFTQPKQSTPTESFQGSVMKGGGGREVANSSIPLSRVQLYSHIGQPIPYPPPSKYICMKRRISRKYGGEMTWQTMNPHSQIASDNHERCPAANIALTLSLSRVPHTTYSPPEPAAPPQD